MPRFASLIFHSLAARYATVLRDAARLTGKRFRRLAIVGGGSLNCFLNQLTAEATGLKVFCKLEYLQRTGSFKERGACNALLLLSAGQKRRGVIAASAG